jgi:hypothetical protein
VLSTTGRTRPTRGTDSGRHEPPYPRSQARRPSPQGDHPWSAICPRTSSRQTRPGLHCEMPLPTN